MFVIKVSYQRYLTNSVYRNCDDTKYFVDTGIMLDMALKYCVDTGQY